MGIRILSDADDEQAVLYSSSTDWAFGPVFSDDGEHTASERAHAFCEWTAGRDPRMYDETQLEILYMEWRKQEKEQWIARDKAEKDKYAADYEDN